MLHQAVTSVMTDEKAMGLAEVEKLSPDGKQWRRFQVVVVVRNDRPAEFWRDLGPRERFAVGPFQLASALHHSGAPHIELVHSVGELLEQANYVRELRPPRWGDEEPPNLVHEAQDQLEQTDKLRRGVSTFGAGGKLERRLG